MKDYMDILIINPGSVQKEFKTEHLGIASLKSYLNFKGYQVDTLDTAIEELSIPDTVEYILKRNPLILGISLIDATKKDGLEIAKKLRSSGYGGTIITGGYFPTFASYELLNDFPEIDFVVRGEGELTLEELCQKLIYKSEISLSDIKGLSYREANQIIENPPRDLIDDLDFLPPVDRKYTQTIIDQSSHIRISASRGCWGQCSFCDINNFYKSSPGKKWRRRSIKHLVDEIQLLVNTYDENYFIFNDDQFLGKGKTGIKYVQELAKEVKRRKLEIKFELMCRADVIEKESMVLLKSIGLQRVFLGIESFNAAQLKRFNKKISVYKNIKSLITLYKLKIDVIASVILADAYTTLTELLEQFYLLYRLRNRYFNSAYCQISVNKQIEVYRGSDIYKQYKANGFLKTDHYLQGYAYHMKFWTKLRLKILVFEEKIGKALFLNFLSKSH